MSPNMIAMIFIEIQSLHLISRRHSTIGEISTIFLRDFDQNFECFSTFDIL